VICETKELEFVANFVLNPDDMGCLDNETLIVYINLFFDTGAFYESRK
jgi:hypothetical protein